jgi:hypothetical protein
VIRLRTITLWHIDAASGCRPPHHPGRASVLENSIDTGITFSLDDVDSDTFTFTFAGADKEAFTVVK